MILKLGDHSTNVALWQSFLQKRGFTLTADSNFGPATEAATRAFQNIVGLRGDGMAGPLTFVEAAKLGFAGFPASHEEPKDTTGKLFLISAGHTNVAGQDRGAAGNGFIEGVLTVELRDAVAAQLRSLDKSVIEDGADGINDPLTKAVVLARKADVAIEFHWNAGPPTATGIEVLSKANKKLLAQGLAKAIGDATGIGLRGDKGWKADNSGAHHRLAFCEAGGLIVEVCFVSNANDMKVYRANFDSVVKNVADVLSRQ